MTIDRRSLLRIAAGMGTWCGFGPPSWSADSGAPSLVTTLDFAPRPVDPSTADADAALAYGSAVSNRILRIKPGTDIAVTLKNGLSESTDLDWHGMRLPAQLETIPGLSGNGTAPGDVAKWTLRSSDTGTGWVHPSYTPGWSNQTGRGLAAVVIVEEPDAPEVDADTVLFLADRLGTAGAAPADTLTVNAKAWPQADTHKPGARLRLRLVNGSTRQALTAAFSGAEPLVIGIDGQPSELFRPLNDTLPLGPGARFDLMVDLPRGAGDAPFRILLRGPETAPAATGTAVFVAKTEGAAAAQRPPIHSLTPNPALPPVIHLEHATRVDLAAAVQPAEKPGRPLTWTLNGASGIKLAAKPLFSVKRNTPVTLGFTNKSPQLTAFRVHGHVMRLLHSKDDGWEPYWRDTILVAPGMTFHAAFLADNPGRWLIDSPFFDQAVGGFRTWFEVR